MTHDERWAAWVAKNRTDDLRSRHHMRVVGALVAVGLLAAMATTLW